MRTSKKTSKKIQDALEGSIRKWLMISRGKLVDKGINNCPLCELLFNTSCDRCPVRKRTKFIYCAKTPYTDWCDHQEAFHPSREIRKVRCKKCKTLAIREHRFLCSLRTGEKK